MGLHGCLDVEGQGQGCACLLAGNERRGACPNGLEEGEKLETKRFARGDGRLVKAEGGATRCQRRGCRDELWVLELRGCGAGVDADDQQVLPGIVDRDVLMRLKETKLADAFGRDAAGGEVGDATGVELDTNVRDINLGGEDGKADGADLADGRLGKLKDDVEVVDHEIEDDVDVQSARAEDGETVSLEEHGVMGAGGQGCDGGIEALEVAYLDEALVLVAELNELVSLGQGRGDGLFNQDVDAGSEERGGGGEMAGCGDADGGGMGLNVLEAGVKVGEYRDAGLGGDCLGAFGVRLDDGSKDDREACGLQFAVDADVIAAEGTGAADNYLNGAGNGTSVGQVEALARRPLGGSGWGALDGGEAASVEV